MPRSGLLLSLILFVSVPAEATRLYWSVHFVRVERADPDGSRRETIIVPAGEVHGLALDLTEGYLYRTEFHPVASIVRTRRNGSEPTILVTSGLVKPYGLALDLPAGKMYWTDFATQKVQRANLNGTGVEDLVTGLGEPWGVIVDAAAGHVIWVDHDTGLMQRRNLDGSGPVTTIRSGLDEPAALAFDPVNRKLYWSEKGAGTIRRGNVDGTGDETLVSGVFGVLGLVLNLREGLMYWTHSSVMRSTMDGASVTELFDFPTGFDAVAITLDPEIVLDVPTFPWWGFVILTLALMLAGSRRAIAHPATRRLLRTSW